MQKAKRLLADALRLDMAQISNDASMKTMKQWDSLSHMELIVLVEEHLGCTLSQDEFVQITTLEGLDRVLVAYGDAN
ncbi:acyl carrier protein [Herbaspirillum sp. GCM10030257]|uniref:acyl carrier protein n=1 Tax=Herbaspirillum sp. GCM10030257 TaxID=3273393 RepID=UPI00361DDE61